jgi:hypothetical protein
MSLAMPTKQRKTVKHVEPILEEESYYEEVLISDYSFSHES